MSLQVVIRAKAKQDIIDLADYIAMDDIDIAVRFLDAVEEAFRFLSDTPGAGASREYFSPKLSGLRMWPIRGFEKHLVFYRQMPKSIEIVRVIHGARDIEAIFEGEQAP